MNKAQQAALVEGLFVSWATKSDGLSVRAARRLARSELDVHGASYCAAQMATEFGDHPDTALPRSRWARETLGLAA